MKRFSILPEPVERKAAIKPTVIRPRMVYTAHSKIISHALSGGYTSIAMGGTVTGTFLSAFSVVGRVDKLYAFILHV